MNVITMHQKTVSKLFLDNIKFDNEALALISLKNPKFIVELINIDFVKKTIVTKKYDNDLCNYFLLQKPTILLKFKFINQIESAISYIHSKNVYHNDLKMENILVQNEKIVLCDFEGCSFLEKKSTRRTEMYTCPVYNINKYQHIMKKKNLQDIYSLGVCICLILTGHFPKFAQKKYNDVYIDYCTNRGLYTKSVEFLFIDFIYQKLNIFNFSNIDRSIKITKNFMDTFLDLKTQG